MEFVILYGVVFYVSLFIILLFCNVILIGVFFLVGEGNKVFEWVFVIKKIFNIMIIYIFKIFLFLSLVLCFVFSFLNNMFFLVMKVGGGFNCWIKYLIGKEC